MYKDGNGNEYADYSAYAEEIFNGQKHYTELTDKWEFEHSKEIAKRNRKTAAKVIAGMIGVCIIPPITVAVTEFVQSKIRKAKSKKNPTYDDFDEES